MTVRDAKVNAGRSARLFPEAEFRGRLARIRKAMQARGLDGLLVSSPENIFYLTGLAYQGYFAFHVLIVPQDGTPVLVTRAMERAIIRDRVPDVRHVGYADGIDPVPTEKSGDADLLLGAVHEGGEMAGLRPWSASLGVATRGDDARQSPYRQPARATLEALAACGLAKGRLGLEKAGPLMPFGIAEAIVGGLPGATIEDASDLVTDCRLVQSALELAYTRKAAEVADSMMLAAMAAAGAGVHQRDVMAAIYQTMFARGGTYPAFVPLVRSTRTLEHEHGTWEEGRLRRRDVLFIEMGGCVARYHAPLTRLVFIGRAPGRTDAIRRVCEDAIAAAEKALRPGARAGEVYAAWQRRVDEAGLAGYRRHHCGYAVGIGFPPSWAGSGVPIGLRAGSTMELRPGMVFHLMSWLLRTGKGDYVLSDTVVVTETGCEVLTRTPRSVIVR